MPNLKVNVIKVEGLPLFCGTLDVTDPFIKVSVGRDSYKTDHVQMGGTKANFDETFVFKSYNGQTVKFEVRDRDFILHDKLAFKEMIVSHDYRGYIEMDMIDQSACEKPRLWVDIRQV